MPGTAPLSLIYKLKLRLSDDGKAYTSIKNISVYIYKFCMSHRELLARFSGKLLLHTFHTSCMDQHEKRQSCFQSRGIRFGSGYTVKKHLLQLHIVHKSMQCRENLVIESSHSGHQNYKWMCKA